MPIFNSNDSTIGSRIKMRLIIMGVIGLIAVISYVSKFEKDPITGKYRAVALNPDQEIAMGLQSAPEMANEMGGAIDPRASEDARHVSTIGQKLVNAYAADAESPYASHFDFHLLNDRQTINAFALPGGQIFITQALYDRLENEAQLGGVLGHEIGHVIHRHASEHMAKSELGQSLVGAVAVGSGDQSAARIAQAVNQMIQLKYGRQDESQSDKWGLENMSAAGYDPRQMIRVMEILKESTGGGGRGPDIFASHPNPDQRIVDIKEYIKARWHDNPPTTDSGSTLGHPAIIRGRQGN